VLEDSREDLAPEDRESLRSNAASFGDSLLDWVLAGFGSSPRSTRVFRDATERKPQPCWRASLKYALRPKLIVGSWGRRRLAPRSCRIGVGMARLAEPCRAVGPTACRIAWAAALSLRSDADDDQLESGANKRNSCFYSRGGVLRRCRRAHRALSHTRSGCSLAGVQDFWDDTLSVVQVKTPDRSMDILVTAGCCIRRSLPGMGADGVLSVERRLRISRSVCRMSWRCAFPNCDSARAYFAPPLRARFEAGCSTWWCRHRPGREDPCFG